MKILENDYKNVDRLIDESKAAIFWKEKPLLKKQLAIWNLKDLETWDEKICTIAKSHGLPNECYISQEYIKIENNN